VDLAGKTTLCKVLGVRRRAAAPGDTTGADRSHVVIDARLTDELQMLKESVRRFAVDRVAPVIGAHYEARTFPYELIAEMGEMGLFGLPFPESEGGMGGDFFALCIALEELARVDSSVAVTLEVAVGLGAMAIHRFGNDVQKRTWMPALCAGRLIGAFGLTEPTGGSDAGATRTTAVLDGDEWVINGTKAFITNSGTDITGFVIVTAVTGRLDGLGDTTRPEISTILVPSGAPGFTVAKGYSKVGWNASDTHELAFSDCRVPAANLIGERGRGYAQFLALLDEGRIAIAAMAVGLAQGALDESLAYAQERIAFGRPIGTRQGLQFALADMDIRAHTARLAYYEAAGRMLRGDPFKKQAAIAKLYASDAAVDNARAATQIHGGYGYMNDSVVGRMWRDAKILEIGEGTSEILRIVIARELGLERESVE
jgi:alkylation response protein AidB-like acyl-CoA dehydrogenase